MDRSLKRALEASPEGREYLAAKKKAKSASRARTAPRRKAGDAGKQASREESDRIEREGKAAAKARAEGRCEWLQFEDGFRCQVEGSEADHVLGGRWKKDMEALPNGEGFQWLCAYHHHVIKHGSDRQRALRQAASHAAVIGSRGLARHVASAIWRYEAKHPARASSVRRAEGGGTLNVQG